MNAKRVVSVLFAILLTTLPEDGFARRGCCSHHGGVCGDSCCDGTPLSVKCRGGSSSSERRKSYKTRNGRTDPRPVYVPSRDYYRRTEPYPPGSSTQFPAEPAPIRGYHMPIVDSWRSQGHSGPEGIVCECEDGSIILTNAAECPCPVISPEEEDSSEQE